MAACIRKKGARALTANSAAQSSRSASRNEARLVRPAALTSASIRPNRPTHSSTSRPGAVVSARSAATNAVGVPAWESDVATSLPRAGSRPVTSRPPAPERASVSAIARPMPCVAPVTSTTLPSNRSSIPPPERQGPAGSSCRAERDRQHGVTLADAADLVKAVEPILSTSTLRTPCGDRVSEIGCRRIVLGFRKLPDRLGAISLR